jgi:hypothetical protein
MAENEKTESNSPCIRDQAQKSSGRQLLSGCRSTNQTMAQIEAEAERQYPFTKRSLPVPAACQHRLSYGTAALSLRPSDRSVCTMLG